MGRPRTIQHLEPQPGAQVHPEHQLQGDGRKASIIIILILLPGHDTVLVERTIQLMGIGSTSPPHELRGGSRDDGAPSNLRLVKGSCPISSRI
jgi:hypothetical protein